MKEEFNDFIEKYKYLTVEEKREEILEKVRDMLNVLGNFSNINNDLINREILDLKKSLVNEDDYLEGLFVYINMLEDLVAKALINLSNK